MRRAAALAFGLALATPALAQAPPGPAATPRAAAEVLDRLGYQLGQAGKTEEAIARFREAARLAPTLFDAQYHLGATLWWTKQPEEALPALRTAVKLDPKHPEARFYLGLVLKQQGDIAGAVAELREATRLSPRFAVRAFQVDYLHTTLFNAKQNNLRFSTGLVYRWGTIKKKHRTLAPNP